MKYKVVEDKLIFDRIDPKTQEQVPGLFGKDEVEVDVEGSDMWITFEGKKILTINHPGDYIRMGWIEPC